MREGPPDMPDDWQMKHVADPARPGQSMLVIERRIKCSSPFCNRGVILRQDEPMEDREKPYEEIPQVEIDPIKNKVVVSKRPRKLRWFTQPKKKPEEIALKIPRGWRCTNSLPTNRSPGDFLVAVQEGANPFTAWQLYKSSLDRWGRWTCSFTCETISELSVIAEKNNWSMMRFAILAFIIRVVFFFAKVK